MHNENHWKHACGEHTQFFRELRSQPVEVEHQPFIDPILDEKNDKVAQVKDRHTCRESESYEYREEYLSIPHLKDEVRACVHVLVVVLDDG